MLRRVLVGLLISLLPSLAHAGSALDLGSPKGKSSACGLADISADEALCSESLCDLRGNVVLKCDKLTLTADSVQLHLTADQQFDGADARGNAMLVEDNRIINCQHIWLGPDRVQAHIDQAVIRVKDPLAPRDANGVPQGRSIFTFRGEMDRRSPKEIHVEDGDFTMCDCGEDPPSWTFKSSEIDAHLGDRAIIWWPQLWIQPFSFLKLPITPPMAPLALPLKRRAAGFLAPTLKFLRMPYPMIDLPFFVPMGPSWDFTLIPGMRFDWGSHQVSENPFTLSSYGAPRLGARVRYAPSSTTTGEADVMWLYDGAHSGARQHRGDLSNQTTSYNPATDPYYALVNRVSVKWEHDTQFSSNLEWTTGVEWLSDDLVNNDLQVQLQQRVANYIPSRSQLLWRSPNVAASLNADYLLHLRNDVFSNANYRELELPQRSPTLSLYMTPTAIADNVYVDGQAALMRYGGFTPSSPTQLALGNGNVGMSYLGKVGAVQLSSRVGLDSLWLYSDLQPTSVDSMVYIKTDADIPLMKAYGNFYHTLTPRMSIRAVPWHGRSERLQSGQLGLDERTFRSTFYQGALSLSNSLWTNDSAILRQVNLELSQPFDLSDGQPLQSRAELQLYWPSFTNRAWTSINWRQPSWIDGAHSRLSEIGTNVSTHLGPWAVTGQYVRWSTQADRFLRTMYQLAAPATDAPLTFRDWVHSASLQSSLGLGGPFALSYSSAYLLPRPGDTNGQEVCGTDPDDPTRSRNSCFLYHNISLVYTSSCNCWSIGANVAMPGRPYKEWGSTGLRVGFNITVGGYAVGN